VTVSYITLILTYVDWLIAWVIELVTLQLHDSVKWKSQISVLLVYQWGNGLVVWRNSNALCQINEVTLRRAWLVLGWVTACKQVNSADPKLFNRSTQNLKQVITSAKRPLCKISCKSVHWGPLGKWVKNNEIFSSIYTPFFVDRPTGQTARWIHTRDGSKNAASRKGQTFSGTEIRS